MEHPHTNDQAKTTNKVILNELKKKFGQAKSLWADGTQHLVGNIIAHHDLQQKNTPFRLTYGTYVMIPVELGEACKNKFMTSNTKMPI